MRPEVKRWFKIVFCTLMVVFSVSIGFSDWVYPDDSGDKTSGDGKPTQNEIKPCAYIDDDENTLYTIEDALSKAASLPTDNVVYVKPGTNPTIYKNCTIAKGDTLLLSYQKETSYVKSNGAAVETGGAFSYGDSTKMKNNITISDGVTLTNNGTIDLKGVLSGGGGGQAGSGQTSGLYCNITLGNNSTINNYGTLLCFGFIQGQTGKIKSYNGSQVELPFVIDDFRGGAAIAAMVANIRYRNKSSYFNQFEISNIFSNLFVYYGANIVCHTNIYAETNFHSSFILIGLTNALFILTDANSYMCMSVDSNRIASYDIYGSIKMGVIEVKIGSYGITSDDFDLPISFRQRIKCHPFINDNGTVVQDATVTLPNYYKLLPGAYFEISKRVTLTCQNRLFVYGANNFENCSPKGTPYPSTYISQGATFIVNGTFQSTEFGGLVQTGEKGATIKVSSSVSPTIREYNGGHLGWMFTKKTENLNFYKYSNGTISNKPTNGSKNVTYVSDGNESIGWGFYAK